MNSNFSHPNIPSVRNEAVKDYAPGSHERAEITNVLRGMRSDTQELPLVIGGRHIETGKFESAISPHDHARIIAKAHLANADHTRAAINAALSAHGQWSRVSWPERAAIFLKAADLLAGPWRARMNAVTMLGQSKTVQQAEIDSAAELADFWRFNVSYMSALYEQQPLSPSGIWNRVEYRPLEGFIYAVTPFNFTAIAGNLPTAPALMGNTVVWKPSAAAKLSAHYIMLLLEEAGLPPGVINLVNGDPVEITSVVLSHEMLAGVHFTGSTSVFDSIQNRMQAQRYRNYPRIVGETGGKNFIVSHPSADIEALKTAIIRGGYEYQGQKCSAASRVFAPKSIWPELRDRLVSEIETISMGDVSDFSNFMGAVINETAWSKHHAVINAAVNDLEVQLLAGGKCDKSVGYFVAPTLFEVKDPRARYMREEFFGPIVSVYVYDDDKYDNVLGLIDETSDYGLTGAVFSQDRATISQTADRLRYAAGNFYINDKPTGAVVGQQPFGGSRASGTNDKAGSMWNLARWVSPRTVKESFVSPRDYRYQYMQAD